MPIGSPFHSRTLPLCESLSFREWAGYFAPSSYEPLHDHEYNALRTSVGVIDVSPLFKYIVSGKDAAALVDRVITRQASALEPGQVIYTPWCNDRGHVLDDGTVARLSEDRFRWTAAEPNLRWIQQHATGLNVCVEDVSERTAALAVQGPYSGALLRIVADADISGLKYFRLTAGSIGDRPVEISRTGYTGDLGYEIWMDREHAGHVWDTIAVAGRQFGLKPVGLLALDVARVEAGLLLLDVDFFSARKAVTPSQFYSPFEMGLGRLVDPEKARFTGKHALDTERVRGSARRIVGVTMEWSSVESLYDAAGLPPAIAATVNRSPVPIYANNRQVGRMTSSTWSPVLKQMIGLATVESAFAHDGSKLEIEHTVDAVRHRATGVVTKTPFFDPARKKARVG